MSPPHPALEGAVQSCVLERQGEGPVGDGGLGDVPSGEGRRTDQPVALGPPGFADGPGGRPVRRGPVPLGALGGVQRRLAAAERVVEAERGGQQPVDRHQVADHTGDRGPAADLALLLEPPQAHRRVPFGVPDVAEQRVEPGGLGVVRGGPLRHRDPGRAAAQTAVHHPGPQGRVEIQGGVGVQQPHRVPQPQRLVRARGAHGQVLLHGGGLLRRTGGQGPGAEKGLEDPVGKVRDGGHERLRGLGRLRHGLFRWPRGLLRCGLFRRLRGLLRCGLFGHGSGGGGRSGRRQRRQRHGLQVEVVRRPARARYPAGAAHLLLASLARASVAAHRARP